MTHRYTQKDLIQLTVEVNRLLGRPESMYDALGNKANVGHLFVNFRYMHLCVVETESCSTRSILCAKTKRELHGKIKAFAKGVSYGKELSDNSKEIRLAEATEKYFLLLRDPTKVGTKELSDARVEYREASIPFSDNPGLCAMLKLMSMSNELGA